jgi:hypothetical protein
MQNNAHLRPHLPVIHQCNIENSNRRIQMLSYKTVDIHTLDILKQISAAPEFSGFRLVGGTSLALQYGHRKSIDLDFFGTFSENTLFSDILRKLGQLSIIKETPRECKRKPKTFLKIAKYLKKVSFLSIHNVI